MAQNHGSFQWHRNHRKVFHPKRQLHSSFYFKSSVLQWNLQDSSRWNAIPNCLNSSCQLICCSDAVTFSCSIEPLNRANYPIPFYSPPFSWIPVGQRLQSTIALGSQNLSEILMKELFQLLVNLCNLPLLSWEPGMRPMEPEDNLSDQYPNSCRIQNFPCPWTLTHCPWNTLGCFLGVIFFFFLYYIC